MTQNADSSEIQLMTQPKDQDVKIMTMNTDGDMFNSTTEKKQ